MAKWPLITKWPALVAVPNPLGIVTSTTALGIYLSETVTIGTGVSSWTDLSGANRHMTQATGANQPAWSASDAAFNGYPSVTFDGVNDNVGVTMATGVTTYIWMVLRQISWISGGFILTDNGGATNVLYDAGGTASPQISQYNGAGPTNTNSGAAVGSTKRVAAAWTNSNSDFVLAGSSTITGANSGSSTSTTLRIGGTPTTNFANVAVAALFVYPALPSAAERAALDNWGASKYGSSILT